MPPISDLTQLTRSIMLGVSVGTVALTQVGCTPYDLAQAGLMTEQEACARALASRTTADVNLVLELFPNSQCIPSMLAAMPPATLASLSPAALAGLSPEILRALPQAVRAQLPVGTRSPVVINTRFNDNDDNDDY